MPAISITVWDMATGQPINDGITGLAVRGNETHSLEAVEGNVFWVYGETGTYSIFLAREDYLPWYKSEVIVTGSRCLISTTHIRAEMVPTH
jgi:hypothetical protein